MASLIDYNTITAFPMSHCSISAPVVITQFQVRLATPCSTKTEWKGGELIFQYNLSLPWISIRARPFQNTCCDLLHKGGHPILLTLQTLKTSWMSRAWEFQICWHQTFSKVVTHNASKYTRHYNLFFQFICLIPRKLVVSYLGQVKFAIIRGIMFNFLWG